MKNKHLNEMIPTSKVKYIIHAIIIMLLISFANIYGSGYYIEGSLTTYDASTNILSKAFYAITVNGKLWNISTIQMDTDKAKGPHNKNIAAYDGTNVYNILYYENNNSDAVNSSSSEIEINDIPFTGSGLDQFLWFPYCSKYYFEHEEKGRMKLLFDGGFPELRHANKKAKVNIIFLEQPPYLPKSIDIYNDGNSYEVVGGQLLTHKLPSPYSSGSIVAKYKTLETTNQGKYYFPSKWEIEHYSTKNNGTNAEDVKLIMRRIGLASLAKTDVAVSIDDIIPKTDGKSATTDYRFLNYSNGLVLKYLNRDDGGWLNPTSMTLNKVLKIAIENNKVQISEKKPDRHYSSYLFTLLILVVMIFIPVYALRKSK